MLSKPDKPYKAPTGQFYTQALFWEAALVNPKERWVIDPVFTLDMDKPGYISARRTFVECMDPTGYKWAMQYLGDYRHWLRLLKCPWFVEALETWKHEIQSVLRSRAIARIIEIAGEEGPQALNAAKYVAEEAWEKPAQRRAGRPSKAEMDAEMKRAVKEAESLDADIERIGLKVIKGGKSG